MKVIIEIAKLRSKVATHEIEEIVFNLLREKRFRKNSIVNIPSGAHLELNSYRDQISSITFNNIPESFERSQLQFCFFEFSCQGEITTRYFRFFPYNNFASKKVQKLKQSRVMSPSRSQHLLTTFYRPKLKACTAYGNL